MFKRFLIFSLFLSYNTYTVEQLIKEYRGSIQESSESALRNSYIVPYPPDEKDTLLINQIVEQETGNDIRFILASNEISIEWLVRYILYLFNSSENTHEEELQKLLSALNQRTHPTYNENDVS